MKLAFWPTLGALGTLSAPAFAAQASDPKWWVAPGESDFYSLVGLVVFFLAILLVVHLYARFDHHTEQKAHATPLRTTIPTMLTIALAYETLPGLDHFSMLLPGALLLTAIARDFMLWWQPEDLEQGK